MKQRIDIEVLGARTDVEVRAVGRQIGLGFIGPQRVESLAQNVFADRLPVPLRGVGVGGVDVGAGLVVGQPVDGRAVSERDEPALLAQLGVEAVIGHKARPHADHGLESHVVELLVHRRRVGPRHGIEVHLAHIGVVEPVDHQHVGGEMAVAIALGDCHHLVLRGVALFALDVSVSGLGQHGRRSGQQPVAGEDLVGRRAGDHEERDAVADSEVHRSAR